MKAHLEIYNKIYLLKNWETQSSESSWNLETLGGLAAGD